ncbi:MAG: RAD55 family ATPase [Archaeoglobaceae archaeon]
MDYAKFGILKLDEYLGGGLDRSSINLIIGRSGIGKTVLAAHWAAEGARNDEKVVYISTTMNKFICKSYLGRFGFMKDVFDKINWKFVRWDPKFLMPLTKEKLLEGLELIYGSKSKDVDRIILDSCTDLENTLADVVLYRRAMSILADLAYEYGITALWIEEAPMKEEWSPTKNFAEAVLFLDLLRVPEGYTRAMRILKKYRNSHPLEFFPYEITNEGIVIKDGWFVRKDYEYEFKPSRQN